jgi:hypothetical protein
MSVKMMLDDAAAEATVGLRIDVAAAQRRADENRARARHRATTAMAGAVALAAVVTLITVLLPGGMFRAVAPAQRSPAPIGLPDRWHYSPPWTPPVTRHPMPAASMVLAVPLQSGWSQWRGDGPVLVSADGTSYASLPWSRWDGLLALAASGRDVAWVTQPSPSGAGPDRTTVHRVHLADGSRRDAELPAEVRAAKVFWEGDQLFVVTTDGVWAWEPSPDGDRLRRSDAPPAIALEPVPVNPDYPDTGDLIVSPQRVRDPSGTRVAALVADPKQSTAADSEDRVLELLITGGSGPARVPITGTDPISSAQVVGWADGGIVVRVRSLDEESGNYGVSLRLYDPDDLSFRIVSRRASTFVIPVAVAADVVGAGTTVRGVKPTFESADRSHLQFLIMQGWHIVNPGPWGLGLLGFVLLGVLVLVVRRRRRGPAEPAEAEAGEEAAAPPGPS